VKERKGGTAEEVRGLGRREDLDGRASRLLSRATVLGVVVGDLANADGALASALLLVVPRRAVVDRAVVPDLRRGRVESATGSECEVEVTGSREEKEGKRRTARSLTFHR
jgi:hypothetical protein